MQWKLFLEGKVEQFLDQVQALEDEVAATVQAFSDRTSTMIKGLSDTVLAAVGVLIGSFIAALVKGEPGAPVLWIGIGAYLVYVLVFPLFYNMTQQWQSHRELCEQFALRQDRFEERLYADKVREIVGDRIRRSKIQFRFWYGLTLVTYVAVAVAIILVVLFVTPIVKASAGANSDHPKSVAGAKSATPKDEKQAPPRVAKDGFMGRGGVGSLLSFLPRPVQGLTAEESKLTAATDSDCLLARAPEPSLHQARIQERPRTAASHAASWLVSLVDFKPRHHQHSFNSVLDTAKRLPPRPGQCRTRLRLSLEPTEWGRYLDKNVLQVCAVVEERFVNSTQHVSAVCKGYSS